MRSPKFVLVCIAMNTIVSSHLLNPIYTKVRCKESFHLHGRVCFSAIRRAPTAPASVNHEVTNQCRIDLKSTIHKAALNLANTMRIALCAEYLVGPKPYIEFLPDAIQLIPTATIKVRAHDSSLSFHTSIVRNTSLTVCPIDVIKIMPLTMEKGHTIHAQRRHTWRGSGV